MSSCFLLDMQDDSIEGIYNTLQQTAIISKHAGGIGLAVHRIRASQTYIRGTNGHSNGLVPMLKVYNDTNGIVLDLCVRNLESGKGLLVEKKTGNNGGNAHERVYKFLSPALQRKVSSDYDMVEKPFVFVFSGKTFQKQKYQDEISLLLEDETYFIMEPGYTNISSVAEKIKEILA